MAFLTISAVAIFLSVILGGTFALKFKDKLHLILGFSAGSVIGVAFFDLLPEAIGLGGALYGVPTITSIVALGFIFYMILDRLVVFHSHSHEGEISDGRNPHRGKLGAGRVKKAGPFVRIEIAARRFQLWRKLRPVAAFIIRTVNKKIIRPCRGGAIRCNMMGVFSAA